MTDAEVWYIILFEFYALVFLGIRSYQYWVSREHKITSMRKSKMDRILVGVVLLLFYFSMAYYPLFPHGTIFFKLGNAIILRVIGMIITFLSLLLLIVAGITLGANWSAFDETYDDHHLVTTSVYSVIRHPIYTALLCFSLGMSLITADLLILILLLLPHILLIFQRMPREESLLLAKFGEEYRNYMDHTKRLIPFIF